MKEMLAAQNDDIVPIKPQKVHVEVLDWQDLNIINRRETILVDSLGTASFRVLGNGQHFSSTPNPIQFLWKTCPAKGSRQVYNSKKI